MLDITTAAAWRGYELIDRDGDKIGTIGEIYLDHETNEPEWATVKTGLFGTRQTFVPIRDAISEGEIVRVPFEKSHVKDAPNVDPGQQLSQTEERELYDHYGVGYSHERSGSQLPEAGAGAGQEPVGEPTGGQGEQAAQPAGESGDERRDEPSGTSDADGQTSSVSARALGETERGGEDGPDRGEEQSPTPEEGERGVAVPGESDPDDGDDRQGDGDGDGDASASRGERRVEQDALTERGGDEAGGTGEGEGETRLRLRRYVVTEEIRVERDE